MAAAKMMKTEEREIGIVIHKNVDVKVVAKRVIISVLLCVFTMSMVACGKTENQDTEGSVTEESDALVEEKHIASAVYCSDLEELNDAAIGFDASAIEAFHLDDLVLDVNEFTLANKEEYDMVFGMVCENREMQENLAGDKTIAFSDFEITYYDINSGGKCIGHNVVVTPRVENCRGFYIACNNGNWYIDDKFGWSVLYYDYETIVGDWMDEIDESKLEGPDYCGVWYREQEPELIIIYNDNTTVSIGELGSTYFENKHDYTYTVEEDGLHVDIGYSNVYTFYTMEGDTLIAGNDACIKLK